MNCYKCPKRIGNPCKPLDVRLELESVEWNELVFYVPDECQEGSVSCEEPRQ